MSTYTGPLWVPGHPVPKGSMKCVGRHVKGSGPRLVPDKRHDPDAWATRVPGTLDLKAGHLVESPVDEPVEMRLEFHLRRPKSADYPDAPISQHSGDLDKLVRMVGDGVQGSGLLKDDSRITKIVAEKIYTDGGEGAHIELAPASAPVGRGAMPVRLEVGGVSRTVGWINKPSDLPAMLRAVADEFERVSG
jgi:endodeoxyribonuclease RusA